LNEGLTLVLMTVNHVPGQPFIPELTVVGIHLRGPTPRPSTLAREEDPAPQHLFFNPDYESFRHPHAP
jgi:hypothetical protein